MTIRFSSILVLDIAKDFSLKVFLCHNGISNFIVRSDFILLVSAVLEGMLVLAYAYIGNQTQILY